MSLAKPKHLLGFTLLELLVVLVILTGVVGLSSPYMVRLYETVRFQRFVKDMQQSLLEVRQAAMMSGEVRRFYFSYESQRFGHSDALTQEIPKSFKVDVVAAAEIQEGLVGVIDFYPGGGSSGGSLEIRQDERSARIRVDWLLGRVTLEPLLNE